MIRSPATCLLPASASAGALGPGIIVAATGVGSGDLVATLIAGERFGYQLLWAVIARLHREGHSRGGHGPLASGDRPHDL